MSNTCLPYISFLRLSNKPVTVFVGYGFNLFLADNTSTYDVRITTDSSRALSAPPLLSSQGRACVYRHPDLPVCLFPELVRALLKEGKDVRPQFSASAAIGASITLLFHGNLGHG